MEKPAAASPWADLARIAADDRAKTADSEKIEALAKGLIDEIRRQHPSADANTAASMAFTELALTHAKNAGRPGKTLDLLTYFKTPLVGLAAMLFATAKPGKELAAAEQFGVLLRSRIELLLSMAPERAS